MKEWWRRRTQSLVVLWIWNNGSVILKFGISLANNSLQNVVLVEILIIDHFMDQVLSALPLSVNYSLNGVHFQRIQFWLGHWNWFHAFKHWEIIVGSWASALEDAFGVWHQLVDSSGRLIVWIHFAPCDRRSLFSELGIIIDWMFADWESGLWFIQTNSLVHVLWECSLQFFPAFCHSMLAFRKLIRG